jgi:hypothetical protein
MNAVRKAVYFIANPPTAWKWFMAAADIGALAGIITWSALVFAVVFTAIILMWFALETHRSNRASRYAGVTMRWALGGGGWTLLLENRGKGVAFNIAIEQVRFDSVSYTFSLGGTNVLYPSDSAEVFIRRTDLKRGLIAPPTPDQLQELELEPLRTAIYFNRENDLHTRCMTEVEIKNPPTVRILSTNWY